MVTPFGQDGEVDPAGVARLIAWFRAAGCTGVVVAGTNGEGPSLGAVEKRDLMRLAIQLAEGLKVILGIATSSLDEAVWLGSQAAKSGAYAILVMPPSYFREAGQEGLARWYEALMDRAPIPTLVYNLPQRTGVHFEPETLSRLARHDRMLGMKDSSGEIANLSLFRDAVPAKPLLVGDEALLMEALRHGWAGTISGAANVIPSWLVAIARDFPSDRESAEAKFELIRETIKAVRSTRQPYSNKEILRRLGVLERSDVRLPLMPEPGEPLEKAASLVESLTCSVA